MKRYELLFPLLGLWALWNCSPVAQEHLMSRLRACSEGRAEAFLISPPVRAAAATKSLPSLNIEGAGHVPLQGELTPMRLPSETPPPRNYGPDGAPNDKRNWHVAELKGGKYGVSPALLIAIRSHENPKKSRDHYAYGVVIKRHTDLWIQAEWAARIVARIARWQGWDPMKPQRGDLYRLALIYVGQGKAAARHWQANVWNLYQKERAN